MANAFKCDICDKLVDGYSKKSDCIKANFTDKLIISHVNFKYARTSKNKKDKELFTERNADICDRCKANQLIALADDLRPPIDNVEITDQDELEKHRLVISNAVDEISVLINNEFHGYRSEVWKIISSAIDKCK